MSEEVWDFVRKLLKEKKEKLDVAEAGLIYFDNRTEYIEKLKNNIEELEAMMPCICGHYLRDHNPSLGMKPCLKEGCGCFEFDEGKAEGVLSINKCSNDHMDRAKMIPLFKGDAIAGWYCGVCSKQAGEKKQRELNSF